MSAQSQLARSDDLSKWCRSVETFEPRFEKWIRYVLRVKDNSCEPEDFIPAITAYLHLRYASENALVSLDELLEELPSKFPVLRATIDGHQRPTTILEERSVCDWFVKAAGVNRPSAVRLKYYIIKIAEGEKVAQPSLKMSKASPLSYEVVNEIANTACARLEGWFGEHLDEDLAHPKGKARAAEDQMDVDPPRDISGHLSDDPVDDDNALSVQARLVTLGSTKVSKRTVETKSEAELQPQSSKKAKRRLNDPQDDVRPKNDPQDDIRPKKKLPAPKKKQSDRTLAAIESREEDEAQISPEVREVTPRVDLTAVGPRKSKKRRIDVTVQDGLLVVPGSKKAKGTEGSQRPPRKANTTPGPARGTLKIGPPKSRREGVQSVPGPSTARQKILGPSTTPLEPSRSTAGVEPFVEAPPVKATSQRSRRPREEVQVEVVVGNGERALLVGQAQAKLKSLSSRRAALIWTLPGTVGQSRA